MRASTAQRPARRGLISGHFLVAAGILLVAAVGWNTARSFLQIYMAKKPVSPPKGTLVVNYQLKNFPKNLGPYSLIEESALPLKEDVLETLGTAGNPNNWYYMAVYEDKQTKEQMRLDITYYTGLLDAVPHVGERCIVAGGGTVRPDLSGKRVLSLTQGPREWRQLPVYRTAYEITQGMGTAQLFQYHVFSMNGAPTESWENVRWNLTLPSVKYCFFAKVQTAPLASNLTAEASDDMTRRFLDRAMPAVLRFLPTRQDIEDLRKAETAK
jgi:hypothetical protein